MTFELASLGWDATFATQYARYARGGEHRPGRVAWVEHGVCTVLTEAGTVRASLAGTILAATAGDRVALPCAGDWVAVRTWPDRRATVEAVLPRRACVMSPPTGGRVLAANLDTVVVLTEADLAAGPAAVARAVRPLVAPGRTLALLGHAGAERSALVDALAGARVLTRHQTLIPIPGGGAVVDIPDRNPHPTECDHHHTARE